MRYLFPAVLLLILSFSCLNAQLTDDFSDNDFTSNPVWDGDQSKFQINGSQQLQLNGASATDTAYLYTANSQVQNTEWNFWVNLKFQPSTQNQVRVYLVSDQQNLYGSLNGYFIQIGETGSNDSVKLYRQDGAVVTKILTSTSGPVISSSNNYLRIKVTCSSAGLWELFFDPTGGNSFAPEGSVTDLTYTTTSWFGVACRFTSSNNTKFYFDDFYIGAPQTDNIPPVISSATVISQTELDVLFSESVETTTAETESNYSADNSLGAPASAVRDGSNNALVHLTFSTPFTANLLNTLTVNNVQDLASNVILAASTIPFTYIQAAIPQKYDIVINEIFPDPSPVIGLPTTEFVEIYNRSAQSYDLTGWKLKDASTTPGTLQSYIIAPGEHLILCTSSATTDYSPFGNVLAVTSFPSLNNTGDDLILEDPNGLIIDKITYTDGWYNDLVKAQGGWTIERINPDDTCGTVTNWSASMNAAGGTPGTQNSIYSNLPDVTPPALSGVTIISRDTLFACFTEPVPGSASLTLSNYSITPTIGNPSAIVADTLNPGCYYLVLPILIDTAILYTLTVNNVSDCSGNVIGSSNTSTFIIPAPNPQPNRFDIVINEFFPDPSPIIGLPGEEFVEIYNRSANTYDLTGWKLKDATGAGTIGAVTLAPGQYVILCPTSAVADYTPFGQVIGVTSFPSLNNAGDYLALEDPNGILLDELNYTDTWYNDLVKAQGGWTLERINPSDTCGAAVNWSASNDVSGGTPGLINSIYSTAPDAIAPELSASTIISRDSLKVCFSEKITLPNATILANYSVSPVLGQPIQIIADTLDPACFVLVFSNLMDTGTVYTLTVSNVSDCAGNVIGTGNTLTFSIPPAGAIPDRFDIVINELFPDPSPVIGLPTGEFVEVYNRSSKTFDLTGWKLSDPSGDGTIISGLLNPGEYLILTPTSSITDYQAFGTTVGVTSFPSLNNTGDNISISDPNGFVVDRVVYSDTWYNDLIKADGGYTLERINPNDTCNQSANWSASNALAGGTPGIQNSIFSSSPDVISPTASGATVLSADSIIVCFSEPLEANTAFNVTNYVIDQGIGNPLLIIPFANDPNCYILYLGVPIDTGITYTLTFSNLADCAGNALTGSTSVQFILETNGPAPGRFELVINELFADPSPQIGMPPVEFVELYNRGNRTVDLAGVTLTDGSSTAVMNHQLVAPGSYVIVCPMNDTASYSIFGTVAGVMSFPSLNNTGDNVSLIGPDNIIIDFIAFTDAWYRDATKADGGYTLERINPQDTCSGASNWIASMDISGGTPGYINSVFSNAPDTAGPSLFGVTVTSANSIELCFTESLDSFSLSILSNYQVDQSIGQPVTVLPIGPLFTCVSLTFATPFDTSVIYTLTVNSSLQDCNGNTLEGGNEIEFSIGTYGNLGEVIINEIFPDPDPVVGLPPYEYLELFNRTDKAITLDGWKLVKSVTSTAAVFSGITINPKSYLIVTSTTAAPYYTGFGIVVGLTSFPALTNTSDTLLLLDQNSDIIDALVYSSSWYQSAIKKDGGWSLERKDTSYACFNGGNWAESIAPAGGTPGTENSRISSFSEAVAPEAKYGVALNANLIRVYFSEPMDPMLLTDPQNYSIDQGIGQPVFATPGDLFFSSVELLLPNALDTNKVYRVTMNNLRDCPGNAIGFANTVSVGLPVEVSVGDLVINEILFNPFTYGYDFVEIYNKSNNILDLSKLYIAREDPEINTITSSSKISEERRAIYPGEYLCITEEPGYMESTYKPKEKASFLEISGLPSFDDKTDGCVLLDLAGKELDKLIYSSDWHFADLTDLDGVSLERLSATSPTQTKDNWHSAASTYNFATPGYKNSQYATQDSSASVSVAPETFSPDNDGYDDVLTINYAFEKPGATARVWILDAEGRIVRSLITGALLETGSGFFTWDGNGDRGLRCRMGIYIILFKVNYPDSGKEETFKIPCVLAEKL